MTLPWSVPIIEKLTVPTSAGANDSQVQILGNPDLPPCMQVAYNAAIFFVPPNSQVGDTTLDAPIWFMAQLKVTGGATQLIDTGYVAYDPTIGLCEYVVYRRHQGVWVSGINSFVIFEDVSVSGSVAIPVDLNYWQVNAEWIDGSELRVGSNSIMEFDTTSTLSMLTGSTFGIDTGVTVSVDSEIDYGGMVSGQSLSATSFTSTSTAYTTTGGAVIGRGFIMPPSGQVAIHYMGRMRNSGASASTYITIQVRSGSQSLNVGTVVLAADDSQAIDHAGDISDRNGGSYLLSGTPGTAYNAVLFHRVEAGTGTFSERQLFVVPVVC